MNKLIYLLLICAILTCTFGCAASPDFNAPSGIRPGGEAWGDDGRYPGEPSGAMGELDFVWSDNENGYYVYEKDGSVNKDVIIPSTYEGKPVVGIGRHAFGAYSKVENIYIPDSIKIIDSQAFNYCDYLKNVVFGSNSGLLYIKDYAFFNCKSIENIKIPASVVEIGYRAFATCPMFAQIEVEQNNQHYTSINGVLYTKDEKTIVAFAPGRAESQVIIPDGVEVIGAGAFPECDNLCSIYIPDSVISIEKAAFAYCDSLTEIVFGENSQLKTIGESAFRECSSLAEMNIPRSVSVIGRYAFYCDNDLVAFNFGGSAELWGQIEKGEKWDVNTGNYVINCTEEVITKE